jgi:hypothetical protein
MRRRGAATGALLGAFVVGCATNPLPAPPSSFAPADSGARSVASENVAGGPIDAGARGAVHDALHSVYLGNIAIERKAPGKVGGSVGATLTIDGELGVGSEEIERRGLRSVRTAEGVEVSLRGYPTRGDAPRARDSSASFIIDFDTDDVGIVRAQAAREHGERPTMRALTTFVAAFIEKKSLARAYDPASVVARRREGDCTEHAVLLAALGRSFGYAVRVVHGIVFVEENGQLLAGMHAWVEWHDGKVWSPADAAVGEEHDPLYLPLQILEDESPAFGRHLVLSASQNIRRVSLTPR